MKKGIAFTIGALYSLFLSVVYHIVLFLLSDISNEIDLLILSAIFPPLILLLMFLCAERKYFFIGTIVGLSPLVIIIKTEIILRVFLKVFYTVCAFLGKSSSDIVDSNIIFDHIVDFTSYTFDFVKSLIFALLIIYFAYQVNSAKKALKDIIFSISYCLFLGFAYIIIGGLSMRYEMYSYTLLVLSLLLPPHVYIAFLFLSKNKKVYRATVLVLWMFYTIPSIVRVLHFSGWKGLDSLGPIVCFYAFVLSVLLTSAIEHLVAFIIYIFKKTGKAPLINQNIMITNYPPKA